MVGSIFCEEVDLFMSSAKVKIRSNYGNRQVTIKPLVAVSIDPGTRNLGWAIVMFDAPINFTNLCLDTNYRIVNFGHVDMMKTESGVEGDGTRAHYSKMAEYHFFDVASNSEFLKSFQEMKDDGKIEARNPDKYQYAFYSENQEGIGPMDRELNPYLADQLMPMVHIGSALGTIMSIGHGVKNINFPNKTAKWGNSTCPMLEIGKDLPWAQKRKLKEQNRTIRKRFFTYYIMDLVERQQNAPMLAKLTRLTMDDRAHLCDAVTQAMRGIMVELWLQLETNINKGITPMNTKLPTNTLPEDVKNRVYGKLGTINVAEVTRVRRATTPKKSKSTVVGGVQKRRGRKPRGAS